LDANVADTLVQNGIEFVVSADAVCSLTSSFQCRSMMVTTPRAVMYSTNAAMRSRYCAARFG